MDRAFKGIWIPAEIWLSEDLSLQEKVFLAEINSLDGDDGCYASNKHFANFFNVSTVRASQVINSLKDKGYIKIKLDRKGKQITRRTIRIDPIKLSLIGYRSR